MASITKPSLTRPIKRNDEELNLNLNSKGKRLNVPARWMIFCVNAREKKKILKWQSTAKGSWLVRSMDRFKET
ncbi:Uncharacterized protein APZ42_010124, partial [Daphnia magna]